MFTVENTVQTFDMCNSFVSRNDQLKDRLRNWLSIFVLSSTIFPFIHIWRFCSHRALKTFNICVNVCMCKITNENPVKNVYQATHHREKEEEERKKWVKFVVFFYSFVCESALTYPQIIACAQTLTYQNHTENSLWRAFIKERLWRWRRRRQQGRRHTLDSVHRIRN